MNKYEIEQHCFMWMLQDVKLISVFDFSRQNKYICQYLRKKDRKMTVACLMKFSQQIQHFHIGCR